MPWTGLVTRRTISFLGNIAEVNCFSRYYSRNMDVNGNDFTKTSHLQCHLHRSASLGSLGL
jgi:predicted NAD-dependent protein-ADP-ribosyltransferase YbiA (DUF1768 family)